MASQEATPSTSQQHTNKEPTNVTGKIIVIAIVVVAILLAVASIALGTMLYLTRKSVKSVPASKLTRHKGKCATPFNDYTHASTHTHTCIHTYIHAYIVSVHNHLRRCNCVHIDLIV